MVTIQIVLIVVVFALIIRLMLSDVKMRVQAGFKLGMVAFAALAIYAVARPDDLTVLANQVGVGRGTDLLLYALVVAFGITTITTYIRFREQEIRYARLVRMITLDEAERRFAETQQPDEPGVG